MFVMVVGWLGCGSGYVVVQMDELCWWVLVAEGVEA